MKVLICYILMINLYGFFLMYFDKTKSKKDKWRIPESKLILTAIFFGSLGIYFGMYFFRHKTKHKKFTIGIPIIIVVQLFIILNLIGII